MAAADKWANIGAITVTESAANTLTFQKLESGVSLFEKVAWVIHRIEYRFTASMTVFADEGDILNVALTANNNMTDITDISNPGIIDFRRFQKFEDGTPATSFFWWFPCVVDFSTLPGGGLIVPPNPLYLAGHGTGLASASTTKCRFYYTTQELKPDEYWELVEARRVIAS